MSAPPAADLRVAAEQMVAASDGVRLAVRDGGNPRGPAILFIHGYLFSSEAFSRQFEGDLARDFRLIAMDLRGHGQSGKPQQPHCYSDSAQWAEDVESVLNALDVRRAILVGWSLGSRIALNYAWHKGFERVSALNLVAATLPATSHNSSAGLAPDLAGLLSVDPNLRLQTTRHFIDLCTHPGLNRPGASQRFLETAMDIPPVARRGSRSWQLPYDDTLGWIAAPTLVTHGAHDPVVALEASAAAASALPRGELSLASGAGHMPFFQSPRDFDRDLRELVVRAI